MDRKNRFFTFSGVLCTGFPIFQTPKMEFLIENKHDLTFQDRRNHFVISRFLQKQSSKLLKIGNKNFGDTEKTQVSQTQRIFSTYLNI
jgi:hypothetical protein